MFGLFATTPKQAHQVIVPFIWTTKIWRLNLFAPSIYSVSHSLCFSYEYFSTIQFLTYIYKLKPDFVYCITNKVINYSTCIYQCIYQYNRKMLTDIFKEIVNNLFKEYLKNIFMEKEKKKQLIFWQFFPLPVKVVSKFS